MSFFGETETFNVSTNEKQLQSDGGQDKVRFEDFPGEKPTKAQRERWRRSARAKMSTDQKAVMRGAVPAQLQRESKEFDADVGKLPALSATASEASKEKRALDVAKIEQDNESKKEYREARLREIKDGLANDLMLSIHTTSGQCAPARFPP